MKEIVEYHVFGNLLFWKSERQISGLTCLKKFDNLDVSRHHVHRCYQGLSSFRNS